MRDLRRLSVWTSPLRVIFWPNYTASCLFDLSPASPWVENNVGTASLLRTRSGSSPRTLGTYCLSRNE